MRDDLRGMTDEAERITELEIKLAYQEHLIQELDALVRSLGAKVDETNRDLKALKDGLRSPEKPPGPANEPPPHY